MHTSSRLSSSLAICELSGRSIFRSIGRNRQSQVQHMAKFDHRATCRLLKHSASAVCFRDEDDQSSGPARDRPGARERAGRRSSSTMSSGEGSAVSTARRQGRPDGAAGIWKSSGSRLGIHGDVDVAVDQVGPVGAPAVEGEGQRVAVVTRSRAWPARRRARRSPAAARRARR